MVFKRKSELNGEIDPNINTKGKIKPNREKSRREIKNQELLSLLRKIKPHLSESIMTAATIMKNKEAGAANQLKAAVILLNAYKELVGDVYSGDDDEMGEEVQPSVPQFSLTMLPVSKSENSKE
jgi:hypothetical protein